jgi:Gas vesicle synthesis protein GvpL/GvpF
VIHVYGVLEKFGELPDVAGVNGSPVEYAEAVGLTIALSRHEGARPEVSDESVLRHADVVDQLVGAGATVLPARFGIGFDDDDALVRTVREHGDDLRASLERVRGCAEFGLRVLAPERDTQREARGADYLRARLSELKDRERLAHDVHEPLAALAREARHAAPTGSMVLSAAYLVPDTAIEDFLGRVRRLESSHPALALVCTGPWPPYSFAAEGLAPGEEP